MFNLLPKNLKEIIRFEYKIRLLITAFISLIFLEFCFIIILLPSLFFVFYKENALQSGIENIRQTSRVESTDPIIAELKGINARLYILNTRLEYWPLTPLIDTILSKKSDSVHWIGFNYASVSTSTAIISVQGVSDDRESLVSFVKSLEKTGMFKKVDLPVSNLAKERDIKFSATLTLVKPKTSK